MKTKDAWSYLHRYTDRGDLRQFWQSLPEVGNGVYADQVSKCYRLLKEAIVTVVKAQKVIPIKKIRCAICVHWHHELGEMDHCELDVRGECKEYTPKTKKGNKP